MNDSLFQRDQPPMSASARIVRVVVERGIESGLDSAGDDGYSYIDEPARLTIGERVEVPLGKRDKPAGGVVVAAGGVELLAGFSPSRVKPVLRTTGTRIPESLLALARWMAEYYICPLGVVLNTLTPAAVKQRVGRKRRVLIGLAEPRPEVQPLKGAIAAAWSAILELKSNQLPAGAAEIAGLIGAKTRREVNRLVAIGLLKEVHAEVVVARGMAGQGESGDKGLEDKGLEDKTLGTFVLMAEQTRAIESVAAAFGKFGAFLLRGVTGSGKTEVYLQLIDRLLLRDGRAIVLVPEISLTPQTTNRFVARFGWDKVAVLHSGLTSAQRHREWARASSGQASVIVGARSAVFAPVTKLGLIVVDEEHDSSYKQDQSPRYNARDVAVKRAHMEGCPVLLGSATPSLESWSNANAGRYSLLEIERRAGGATMPRVKIVNMLDERRALALRGERGMRLIGFTLESALNKTLSAGGQAILLLNRRGFSNYIVCPDTRCAFVLCCDQCDATLVYHKDSTAPLGGVVRCHHCLSEQRVPVYCPSCEKRLIMLGGGTQRAEEELERLFAAHKIVRDGTMLRVDSDTMKSGRDYHEALASFRDGRARVLLGTQMIAKGLDFPDVRLVGVLNADTAAALPDFRASERTFQLLSQVAGRAGRAAHTGEVIVQTIRPDDPAIMFAAAHDFRGFAASESASRKQFSLPPFRRMARIVCRAKDSAKAKAAAETLRDSLQRHAAPGDEVQGPTECVISRIAAYYRFELIVTSARAGSLQSLLAKVRGTGLLKSDAKTAVDVDPAAMM